MVLSLILPILTGLMLLFALPAQAQDQRELARFVDQSAGRVMVEVPQGTAVGSGYVVEKESGARDSYLFLTNEHVIEDARKIEVVYADEGRILYFNAELLEQSSKHDMALLRIRPSEDYDFEPAVLPLANYEIEPGDAVFAVGFPGIADRFIRRRNDPAAFEPVITNGIVGKLFDSFWFRSRELVQQIQHSAAINGGNSGGPLVNSCGTVVGLNTATPAEEFTGAFFSSSAKTILDFLEDTIAEPTMAGRSCARIGALLQNPLNIGLLVVAVVLITTVGIWGLRRQRPVVPAGAPVPSAPPAQALGSSSGGARATPMLRARIGGQSAALGADALARGVTIGRGLQADITIDHGKLSREHAQLRVRDRKLYITDLGSTNGTNVDGNPVKANSPQQINTRSQIELGGIDLTLEKGV